jgi:hypothetical protein
MADPQRHDWPRWSVQLSQERWTFSGTDRKDHTGRVEEDNSDRKDELSESNNLPPAYFSSHSLRKMRAEGATVDDRRDRGNYSAGSQVMNNTYDYATGLGPLGSNSLKGGHRIKRVTSSVFYPPTRSPRGCARQAERPATLAESV